MRRYGLGRRLGIDMKAVLVIDIPEEYMGSDIDVKLYGKYQTIHERYVNKLRPLPEELIPEMVMGNAYAMEYAIGWNDCLDAITGETE